MADRAESARAANRHDAVRIAELAEELVTVLANSRGGGPIAAVITALGGTEELATRTSSPDSGVVVGTYDGVVVGFAVVDLPKTPSPSRAASVTALYVEPEMRRVGVGEAILDEVTRLALGHGASSLDVPALPGDAAMKSFCEAMGLRARLLVMSRPFES